MVTALLGLALSSSHAHPLRRDKGCVGKEDNTQDKITGKYTLSLYVTQKYTAHHDVIYPGILYGVILSLGQIKS